MVNLKLSGLLDKGVIVQEQLIKILQRHEDALAESGDGLPYDDTALKNRIKALEDKVDALEDAQTEP